MRFIIHNDAFHLMNLIDHVLASFQTTRTMPKPNLADVREYQGYLAANAPIAEHETRFLDATDDLVCLADENEAASGVDGYLQRHEDGTGRRLHVPRRRSIQYSPTSRSSLREDSPEGSNYEDGEESGGEDEAPVISLSLAMAVAVIAPIMAFGIVPGKHAPSNAPQLSPFSMWRLPMSVVWDCVCVWLDDSLPS